MLRSAFGRRSYNADVVGEAKVKSKSYFEDPNADHIVCAIMICNMAIPVIQRWLACNARGLADFINS